MTIARWSADGNRRVLGTEINWDTQEGQLKIKIKVGENYVRGTNICRGIKPLYNPGTIPFMLVALLIPVMQKMSRKEATKIWGNTLKQIRPTAIALFFALGLTYIMMNSGDAGGADSMLIVIAKTTASLVGKGWYIFAPIIGILGVFIAGSNTVS